MLKNLATELHISYEIVAAFDPIEVNTRKLTELRSHLDILSSSDESIPAVAIETKAIMKSIREVKAKLLDCYMDELHSMFPKADAIYEDKIISLLGEAAFTLLQAKGKIELCACINGRRLYAI